MSTLPAERDRQQELIGKLRSDDFVAQVKLALPGNVTPERFVRVTSTAILQSPEIVDADRASLFNAVIRCAQDGLLPDGREAALVVVKVKGEKRVSYWPMIGGYRKIAAKHGISLATAVVFDRDEFAYELGDSPRVHHIPPQDLSADRGEPVGAYAVATDQHGQKFLEVMSLAEIEKVRAVSRAATSEYGPWVNWWTEQARKTVGRRLFKQLPIGDLDEASARVLDAGDGEYDFEASRDVGPAFTPPPAASPDDEPLEGEYQQPPGVDVGQVEQSQFPIPDTARMEDKG